MHKLRMKSVLVIQILALWVTVSKSQISITQCPRTECVEGYLDPNDHRVCEVIPAGQSYPLVQMGECKNSGEFCDDNSGAPTIRCKLYQFHPGRYVEKVSQCLSGKMSGGYCIGNLVNEGCKKDVDCNIGLYCALPPLNQICTPLVAHQAECDDTKKCVPYTRCVGIKGSKTCEYLSSQPLKVTVGTGNGIACMSGFEDGGVCAQSWEHNGDPLQDFDKKCTITWQGNDVTNDPRFLGPATPYCRYRQDGKGLCNLSPSALTAQRNGIQGFTSKHHPNCHIKDAERYGICDQVKSKTGYRDAYKMALNMANGGTLGNEPACVQDYQDPYFREYFMDNEEYNLGSMIWTSVGIALAITLLTLLIAYCKNW